MSRLNIGLIGAGNIAEIHLEVLQNLNNCNLLGITSKTNKNSLRLKKKFHIKNIYKNYIDLLDDDLIDTVLILVPPLSTFKILKHAILKRKNIFVEKPAGINLNQSKSLYQLNKKYNAKVMVGFNRRYYSIFSKVNNLIKKDKILGLNIEGHERIWIWKKIYSSKILKKWMYANSTHTIDIIRFFGGEIKTININKKKYADFEYNLSASFSTKKNIIGTYNSYWNSPGGWSIKLFCENNTFIFQPLEKCLVMNKKFIVKEIKPNKIDIKFKPGFYNQMKDFKNFILGKKTINKIFDLNESFKTMKLIHQMYEKN